MCGFSNALSFQSINDVDINYVRDFIRNELLDLILHDENVQQNQQDFDLINFFGPIFKMKTKSFAFQLGEVKLIKAIVSHVKEIIDVKGSRYFQEKNLFVGKGNWKKTEVCSIGRYFVNDNRNTGVSKVVKNSAAQDLNVLQLQNELFNKTHKFFVKLGQNHAVDFTANMVTVGIDNTKIKGSVSCIICHNENKNKQIAVFYNKIDNCWALSNLKKHTKIHSDEINHLIAATENGEVAECLPDIKNDSLKDTSHHIETLSEPDELVLVLETVPDDSVQLQVAENFENLLYSAICAQNIKMINSTLKYNETDVDMAFQINNIALGNVRICKINPDGNCLFGALAHQLYDIKINCVEHIQLTKNIRENVVKNIADNLQLFQHELRGRIYDEENTKIDRADAVNGFLKKLQSSGFWGGSETLKAISYLHCVNIIVFKENGECYSALPLNVNYKRCILLAYRASGANSFNHYDSVCQIKQNEILTCVKYLLISFEKQYKLNNMEKIIIVD